MATNRRTISCRSCSSMIIRIRAVNGKCRKCILSCERKRISTAIDECQYFVEVKEIIELIVDYSMGYSVKCSNSKCRNIININSYHDLHTKFRTDFYSINSKYITHFNKHHFVKMYGKYRRIMCSKCKYEKIHHRCYNCYNKDPEFNVCWNHPHCYICNIPKQQYNVTIKCCEFCNRYYCSIHGLKQQAICKNCEVSISFNQIKKSLSIVIEKVFGNKVVDIIACYANGYAIKCCNESCKEIICVNNTTDYQNMTDANNRKFYHYKINKCYGTDSRQYHLSFDQYERCFCSDCNEMKLKMCCGCIKVAKYENGPTRRVQYHDYSCRIWFCLTRFCNCNWRLDWIYKKIWKISWRQCNNMCLEQEIYCMNHKLIECIECGSTRDEYYMKYDRCYDEDINGWILYCDICVAYICAGCANHGLWDENRKLNDSLKYKKCKHVFRNEKIGKYSFQTNASLYWDGYKYNYDVNGFNHGCISKCRYNKKQWSGRKENRWRTRKKYKLKSYFKRYKDKEGNKESKDKFKKKYMMSLQY